MGVLIKNKVNYSGGKLLMSPECYSLEEKEIGCWIDGKPLYQKTLSFTTGSANTYIQIPHNISNVDTIWCTADSFVQHNNFSFLLSAYSVTTYENDFVGLVGASTFDYRVGVNLTGEPAKVTLLYTKATDQPGSGTWTPQGLLTVHYNTNEQVIGTWVDGSTLYEKTIVSDDSLPYRTWTTIFSETGANIHKWEGKLYINSTKTQSVHLDYHRGQGTTDESCCTMESSGAIRVTQSVINGTTYGYELTVRYTKTSS